MILVPGQFFFIHGCGVVPRSNIISNLTGARRVVAAGEAPHGARTLYLIAVTCNSKPSPEGLGTTS